MLTILATALSVMTQMLIDSQNINNELKKVLISSGPIAIVGIGMVLYVSFVA